MATGSPFEPVVFKGEKHVIGQCNNVFVFPGVGLGVMISEASRVTDAMFLAAARALAEFTAARPAAAGSLYPSLRDLHEVSQQIAFKVAQTARDQGFGRTLEDSELQEAIDSFSWYPDYSSGTQADGDNGQDDADQVAVKRPQIAKASTKLPPGQYE